MSAQLIERIERLGKISEEPNFLKRTFLSSAMAEVNRTVGQWMREANLSVSEDGWGNLIGHWPSADPKAKTLLIGSHLDTVPNAGKYDGPLGVLLGLAVIEALQSKGVRLPFHVDLLAFSEEEGVRFNSDYIGSKALIGQLDPAYLELRDARGKTVAEVVAQHQGVATVSLPSPRYRAEELLGYVEAHIEQGPVLEHQNLSLGVVEAIAAQTRKRCTFTGKAGHAGTSPMNLRRDALAGAAELILMVETLGKKTAGLVATVGKIEAQPGASNVIAQRVDLSLDVRHAETAVMAEACRILEQAANKIAADRHLTFESEEVCCNPAVPCSAPLTAQLAAAMTRHQGSAPKLVSGAGHDGVILSRLTPIAMLFIRCRGGISHHPEEFVEPSDIAIALAVLTDFIEHFKPA